MLLGQRIGATATDVQKLNGMYKCNNGVSTSTNINSAEYQGNGNTFHIF